MFRAHVLIIRRSKLHYTASGIITPIGLMIPEIKFIVKQKFCASSWLITELNTLRCTVSETSKFVTILCLQYRILHFMCKDLMSAAVINIPDSGVM